MQANIYAVSHSILNQYGNAADNFAAVMQQREAIREYQDEAIAPGPFYAARLEEHQLQVLEEKYGKDYSPFEQMCIDVAAEALRKSNIDITADDCILLLSTTKGNIEWINKQDDDRIGLHHSAALIAGYFKMKHAPIVISNACISGSLALITAARMLENGMYKHTIVIGCDRFSGFVFSGFQSFHALAHGLCRPFDKDRTGINLGEAAACMILSVDPQAGTDAPLAILAGGGLSNDANHLSGPSRTGEELAAAIHKAFREAEVNAADIGMISAHGTATVFNDEMEAKALHLAGVADVALHSFKSYIGHTLGAAGIIESIIACVAMQKDFLPASLGYEENGVSTPVNVLKENESAVYDYLLKTASGFGGCNAALVWKKVKP